MSALPPIQWTEQERESGSVSFSQHLVELHKKLTTTTTSTTTTTPSVSTTVTTRSTVEKITHVVEAVVPQLVDSMRHEFIDITTTPPTAVVTTTPFSPTSTTTFPATPPFICNPSDYPHIQVISMTAIVVGNG
jgi:hypothetical protein